MYLKFESMLGILLLIAARTRVHGVYAIQAAGILNLPGSEVVRLRGSTSCSSHGGNAPNKATHVAEDRFTGTSNQAIRYCHLSPAGQANALPKGELFQLLLTHLCMGPENLPHRSAQVREAPACAQPSATPTPLLA